MRIIIFGGRAVGQDAQRILNSAWGFISKEAPLEELIRVIEDAAAVREFFGGVMSRTGGRELRRRDQAQLEVRGCEREVLVAVADGVSNKEIQRLVFGSGLPAVLRWVGFEFDNFVEDVLPGALADHWVAVFQINPRRAEIHRKLPTGLIQRHQQALGFGVILGLEALERLGGVVEGVVNALCDGGTGGIAFYSSISIEPIPELIPAVRQSQHYLTAISRHHVPHLSIVSQTVSHWLSQLPISLLHSQLGLEARVGIERSFLRQPAPYSCCSGA